MITTACATTRSSAALRVLLRLPLLMLRAPCMHPSASARRISSAPLTGLLPLAIARERAEDGVDLPLRAVEHALGVPGRARGVVLGVPRRALVLPAGLPRLRAGHVSDLRVAGRERACVTRGGGREGRTVSTAAPLAEWRLPEMMLGSVEVDDMGSSAEK